ncbi:hypothetical protein [Candidatus Symbiobacter mobilis]
MTIVTVGMDVTKNVTVAHGVDETGQAVLMRPQVTHAKLLDLIANVPTSLISLEACAVPTTGPGSVPSSVTPAH